MKLVILGLTYLQNLCPLVAKTDQFDGQGDGRARALYPHSMVVTIKLQPFHIAHLFKCEMRTWFILILIFQH